MISIATISAIALIATCQPVSSLKCYQCSSMTNVGCFSRNLNSSFLMDCEQTRNGASPVCRSISQVQFFTYNQDVAILRECAYVHGASDELKCIQSKFGDVHYSLVCECDKDGCNGATLLSATWIPLIVAAANVYV